MHGDARDALLPASILLASYSTILIFILTLKAFITDDTTPRKRAKRLLAVVLFRLERLRQLVTMAVASWLALINLHSLRRVQPINVVLIPQHQAHISLSPCWPQGYPHTHYA